VVKRQAVDIAEAIFVLIWYSLAEITTPLDYRRFRPLCRG